MFPRLAEVGVPHHLSHGILGFGRHSLVPSDLKEIVQAALGRWPVLTEPCMDAWVSPPHATCKNAIQQPINTFLKTQKFHLAGHFGD